MKEFKISVPSKTLIPVFKKHLTEALLQHPKNSSGAGQNVPELNEIIDILGSILELGAVKTPAATALVNKGYCESCAKTMVHQAVKKSLADLMVHDDTKILIR